MSILLDVLLLDYACWFCPHFLLSMLHLGVFWIRCLVFSMIPAVSPS